MLGDGQQTRCFTHVKDLARGIVIEMESKKSINNDFNIGSEKETKMIDLAKRLWKLCGRKKDFKVNFVESFKHDIKRRIPDATKADKVLGWKPKIKFENGLKEVVEWLSKELNNSN